MYVFGDLMKQFRIRQGMDQQELADQLKMHRNTITAWERCENLPRTRQKILDLARALYLDEEDTDQLLFAANYPLEYQTKVAKKEPLTRIRAARVEQMIVEHLEVASGPILSRSIAQCDFYAHISLPPNYVNRAEVIREVSNVLFDDTPTITPTSRVKHNKLHALHGMGGIGKTTLARALCDDPLIKTIFPDGILWATLGEKPELISQMREWVNVLGGSINEKALTVDRMKNMLAMLLKERACLLILDDVWHRSHVEAFRIDAPRCCLLLTTRDAVIARELGAKIYPIPAMTQSEAITLLDEWADGHLAKTSLTLKDQIVKRLGHLPLGVKLAGAQLRSKPAAKWLRDFDVRKLRFRRIEGRQDDLELTFRLSLDNLDEQSRRLYITLAIFKEDEAIPQVGIERLWHGLLDLDANETTELLDDLAERALLDVITHQFGRTVHLHDLLRDLISLELGDQHVTVHQALLRSYRASCKGGGWHTADDDGYLYDHLAYHLQEVNAVNDLKELFARQDWMQARVRQRGYDGYIEDLSVAWRCIEAQTRQQIEANEEPSDFAHCVRLLLIQAAINSVAQNYLPEMVARAVELGVWAPQRALGVAMNVQNTAKQAQMYLALLKMGKLSREHCAVAQQLGLDAALRKNDHWHLRVLVTLVPYLQENQRREAIERGLENILAVFSGKDSWEDFGIGNGWKMDEAAEAFETLASQLSIEQRERALAVILTVKDRMQALRWTEYVRVLEALAQSPGDLLDRILDAAQELSEWGRTPVLVALAPHLTGEQLERTLDESLIMERKALRVKVLAALSLQLTGERRSQLIAQLLDEVLPYGPRIMGDTLSDIRYLEFGHERKSPKDVYYIDLKALKVEDLADALEALVPQLAGKQLERALAASLTIKETEWRIKAIAALIPRLPEEKRIQLLEQALKDALTLKYRVGDMHPLTRLTPWLEGELLQQALEGALLLESEWDRARVLTALAPQLTGNLLKRGLEGALAIQDNYRREEVLKAFGPQLSVNLLKYILEATLTIEDKTHFWYALITLASRLSKEQRTLILEHRLEEVLDMKDGVYTLREENRMWALMAVGLYAATLLPSNLLERYLQGALALGNRILQTSALKALASSSTDTLLERRLAITFSIEDESDRAEILAALAPRLTGQLLQQALEAALALESGSNRAKVLAALVPQLEGEQQNQVLEQAWKETSSLLDKLEWVKVLATLLPQLEGEQRDQMLKQALETALILEEEWQRVVALVTLAPLLTEIQLERGLEAVLVLENKAPDRLIAFLPYVSNQAVWLKSIRLAATSWLSSIRDWTLDFVLGGCFSRDFFSPPVFSPTTLGVIVSSITEICEEWRWP